MGGYSAGARFEREVRRLLEDRGLFVTRSAGSKTIVDLTTIGSGRVYLIQCKRSGGLSRADRERLVELANRLRCPTCGARIGVPVLARRDADNQIEMIHLSGGTNARTLRAATDDANGRGADRRGAAARRR